jgi:hypothetical protein
MRRLVKLAAAIVVTIIATPVLLLAYWLEE